ncbi:hypothetical protein ACJX0J_039158, partial [Zea mays]
IICFVFVFILLHIKSILKKLLVNLCINLMLDYDLINRYKTHGKKINNSFLYRLKERRMFFFLIYLGILRALNVKDYVLITNLEKLFVEQTLAHNKEFFVQYIFAGKTIPFNTLALSKWLPTQVVSFGLVLFQFTCVTTTN